MQRPIRSFLIVLLAALSPALAAPEARAQDIDPKTLAEARAIHEKAIAALDAKDFATACPKLERVVEMIPQGIGAKLTLAECYEGAGKLASAWRTYVGVEEAAQEAGQLDRVRIAHKKAEALRPKLAELTIVVPDAVRALPGLEVRRGLSVVEPAQWGVAVPVDVGAQVIVGTATGKRRWEKSVEIAGDGMKASVEVGPLEDERPAAPPPPIVAPAPRPRPSPPSVPPPPAEEGGTSWGGQRIAGLVAGGAGVVALGLGGYFGAQAISKKDESDSKGHCHDGNQCDDVGYALREEGYTAGTVSTVLFVGGAVAVGGGAALFLTAPVPAGEGGAEVAIGPQGVALRGRW